jgi:hypothetical protein
MSFLKPMNVLKLLVIVLLLCALSGCIGQAIGEALGEAIGEMFKMQMVLAMPMAINPQIYYCANGCWPQSSQELECFCSDPNNNCLPLLDKRIKAEYSELPDKRLHVTYHMPNFQNPSDPCTVTVAATLNIPDANNCSSVKEMRGVYFQMVRDCLDPNAVNKKNNKEQMKYKEDNTFLPPLILPPPHHHH